MAGVSPRGIFVSNEARGTSRPAEVCEERATTWDAKRAAALRVAPRMPRGFVVRPSQTAAGRLRPHALPRGILGATKHQRFVRHDTSLVSHEPKNGGRRGLQGKDMADPSRQRGPVESIRDLAPRVSSGMGRPGLQAGCPHPEETWQSRLGSGWITSSGGRPLPLRARDARRFGILAAA